MCVSTEGQGLVLTMRGVDPKVDRDGWDAFIAPGDAVRLCFNLLPDLIKVCELLAPAMKELTIFCMEKFEKWIYLVN